MASGYQIPIDPSAVEKLAAWFEKAGEKVDDLHGKVKDLQKDINGLPTRAGLSIGRIGRGGPDTTLGGRDFTQASRDQPGDRLLSASSSKTLPPDYSKGPNFAIQRAEQRLMNARLANDPAKIEDSQIELKRANDSRDRARKALEGPKEKTQQELIMDALMTSRIGANGALYPLVGKLHKAGLLGTDELKGKLTGTGMVDETQAAKLAPLVANVSKAALPLLVAGAAVAGVAAIGAAVYGAANHVAARYREGSRTYYGLGSNPTTTGQASAIAGASGVDAVAKSRQLGEALLQGTYGAAYLRSRGIADYGSRTVDKGENYVRATDELRRIKSDKMAIRVARDVGLEEELWVRDLSERSYRNLVNSRGEMGSSGERRSEAEYRAKIEGLNNEWGRTVRENGGPLVTGVTWAVSAYNFARNLQNLNPINMAQMAGRWAAERIHGYRNSSKADTSNPAVASGDAQVKATQELTRALKDTTDRVGGGRYASGAIPEGWSSGWRREKLKDALQGQALMMGAFTVN